ncbi:MAG: YihY/virulence factor BrkB family protein [Methylibium sp.]|uniref:YihY/virulence factor BrkB family protein n=1 Tax=Methylibium sp. TaxID=2067992 RepID=UPI0017C7C2D8|nr:YihY/virulence factor BrkB family protein [Methylibium sp.]MBA3596811.1 YihY/virulence factor BrkB family protein [Methylibium sp.]
MNSLARGLRRVRDKVPGLRIVVAAVRNYIFHQSGNQAGSVAFSSVLAMFPLLIVLSAAAAFFGEPGAAAELAVRVLEFAPQVVFEALRAPIDEVLRQRNRTLLVAGVFITVWTASSGTQAVRTALNRAYGVEQGMSFWGARIKVIVFTLIGASITVLVSSSVVILPYVWDLLAAAGAATPAPWLRDSVRYGLAFFVVAGLYATLYGWLPDVRQRVLTVLPGALVGAALWLIAAALLSYTLRNVGKLALVYGGFAGAVATLVFLYACAATLIFGAEINGVLREQAPTDSPSGEADAEQAATGS